MKSSTFRLLCTQTLFGSKMEISSLFKKYQIFQSLLVWSLRFYAFRWNLKLKLAAAFSATRPKLKCSVVPILMTAVRNKAQTELEVGSAPQGPGQRWCCAAAHTMVPLEWSEKQKSFKRGTVKAMVLAAYRARGASRAWQLRHFDLFLIHFYLLLHFTPCKIQHWHQMSDRAGDKHWEWFGKHLR